jgi:aminopeptidase N
MNAIFSRVNYSVLMAVVALVFASVATSTPLKYHLTLIVDPTTKTISATERIERDGTFKGFYLNLRLTGLVLDSMISNDRRIEVMVAGDSLIFEHEPSTSLTIYYHGQPTTGLHITDSELFTAFHTEGWMVCDPRPATKALFDLDLFLPSGLTVTASGDLKQHDSSAAGQHYRFQSTVPVSAYLFGFAAGRYTRSDTVMQGKHLAILSNQFNKSQRDSIFRITFKALKYFESISGKPYPFKSYVQVFTSADNEQEAAGFSLLSNEYIASVLVEPREDWLIAHELAHQWFGNAVTCASWSDFWLHEGMVTYLTAKYKEYAHGSDEFLREIYLARSRYARAVGTKRDRPVVWNSWTKPEDMSGPITYYKGALILNFLENRLGKLFWKGLKSFVKETWLSSASTEDFKKCLELASGRSLKTDFDQWVSSSATPRLSAEYSVSKGMIEFHFEQDSTTFEIPIGIEIRDGKRVEMFFTALTQKRDSAILPLDGDLKAIILDYQNALPIRIAVVLPTEMLFKQLQLPVNCIAKAEAIRALSTAAEHDSTVRQRLIDELMSLTKTETTRLVQQVATATLKTIVSNRK